jgi:hypothetical protein
MVSVEDLNNGIERFLELAFDAKDSDIELKSFPIMRGIAQYEFAKHDCVPYFIDVDAIIRNMLLNLKDSSQK